jgi:AcrR family transcriptional regulator
MYNAKQQAVLTAARGVFLRYGYKRVTMNDLAAAAHISRPGLYLMFPSKEDVFLGVARKELSAMLDSMTEGISKRKTLGEKLSYVFEVWTLQTFELISRTPEAKELCECEFDFARVVVAEGNAEFESILAKVLKEGRVSLPGGLTPKRAAHVLRCAAYGFKRQASTAGELKSMLDDILAFLMAAPPQRLA